MKKIYQLWVVMVILAIAASIGLSDGTITQTDTGLGSVSVMNLSWNSLTNLSTKANIILNGEIKRVTFVPNVGTLGAYDVTMKDADGFDILAGLGANLASNTVVNVAPGVPVTDASAVTNMKPMVASGPYTVLVDNTGVGTGTFRIYYTK